jgi:5'-methylthioadenosine phosphorylase
MTDPYCPTLRQAIIAAGRELGGYDIHPTGTYVCTEGPRFETPAEIAMFAKLGGDLVGMTNVPEVCLAREAEICYSTISMVTNFAAGISAAPLTHAEVVDAMEHNSLRLRSLIMKAIEMYDMEEDCSCRHSLQAYGGFTV